MLIEHLHTLFEVGIALHLGFSVLESTGGYRERALQQQIRIASDEPGDTARDARQAFTRAQRSVTVIQGWMVRAALVVAAVNIMALLAAVWFAQRPAPTVLYVAAAMIALLPMPTMVVSLHVIQSRMFDQVHRRLLATKAGSHSSNDRAAKG